MPFRFLPGRPLTLTALLLTPAALIFASCGTVPHPAASRDTAPLMALDLAPECVPIQNEIDGLEEEIGSLQELLSTAAPGAKPAIVAQIRRLTARIDALQSVLNQCRATHPTPPPPLPSPERQGGYNMHYGQVFGDGGTDTFDPKGLLPQGCTVTKVELEQVDRDGRAMGARGRHVGDPTSWAEVAQDGVGTNRTWVQVKWGYGFGRAIRYKVYYTIFQPNGVQCWP